MCHNTHTHTHTHTWIRLCTNACAHSKQTHSHICSLVAALSSKLSSLQSSPFVLVSKWPLIRMLVCLKSLFPGTSAISVDYWKSFEEVVLFFSPNAQQILWTHTRVHTHTHTPCILCDSLKNGYTFFISAISVLPKKLNHISIKCMSPVGFWQETTKTKPISDLWDHIMVHHVAHTRH